MVDPVVSVCSGYHARLASIRGDAGLIPALDNMFSFFMGHVSQVRFTGLYVVFTFHLLVRSYSTGNCIQLGAMSLVVYLYFISIVGSLSNS